jgi:hypothetical protein
VGSLIARYCEYLVSEGRDHTPNTPIWSIYFAVHGGMPSYFWESEISHGVRWGAKSAPPLVHSQCFSCIDPHSESVQVYTFQKGQVKAANKRYDSAVAGGLHVAPAQRGMWMGWHRVVPKLDRYDMTTLESKINTCWLETENICRLLRLVCDTCHCLPISTITYLSTYLPIYVSIYLI